MQRKKFLAIGIALALQTSYYPAMAADNTDDDDKCPVNISSLSKAEREKLPAECLITKAEQDNHWGWAAGGIAALAAGVALGVHNSDSDGNSHHNVSPTPPDDGGDVTPTPPDDGGDVTPTPPDDGGGDVIPPDDGGDTPTPPDDTSVISFSNGVTDNRGKDTLSFDDIKLDSGEHLGPATLSYSGQDGEWQLTTPNGKTLAVSNWSVTDTNAAVIEGTQENGLYWKYDSRGYLILADDHTAVVTGDDTTHSADRNMNISGDNKTGVIISGDSTDNTLEGDSTVTDGATGIVITGDSTTNTISGQSTVDGGTGALISGEGSTTSISGDIDVRGGGTGVIIDGDKTTLDNTGTSTISGEGSTGSIINGDGTHVINNGELIITDGGTGGKITGDDAVVDNKGDTTASGEQSTGLYVDGDNATINNEGKQDISDGATGTYVNGDGTTFNNAGTSNISGNGSAGAIINGDNTSVINDGELNIAEGGTGASITGDNTSVNNKGNSTISGAGSTGLNINGDNAQIASEGEQTLSDGATGTRIDGNGANINNTGNISADGAGTTVAVINGDNTNLVQDGDLLVTNGAYGIVTKGEGNHVTNKGNTTVRDEGSVGFIIDGKQSAFTNEGDITISQNSVGAKVTGDDATVNLGGDINVGLSSTGVEIQGQNETITIKGDLNVTAQSGDGVNDADGLRFENNEGYIGVHVTSNNEESQHSQLTIDGNINVVSERDNPTSWIDNPDQPAYGRDLAGGVIEGAWNDVVINGSVNVSATPYQVDLASGTSGASSVYDSYQDNVTGIIVSGENNSVNITGGVNVSSTQSTNDWTAAPLVTGIAVSGDNNTVILDGVSSLIGDSGFNGNMTFASISDDSSMVISEDATLNIDLNLSATASVFTMGDTISLNNGASVTNKGTITGDIATNSDYSIISAENNSTALNDTSGLISLNFHKSSGSTNIFPNGIYAYKATANNKGTIEITSDAGANMSSSGVDNSISIVTNGSPMQFTAIKATSGSTAYNEGTISTAGGNTWGITTVGSSTAENTGVINHQGEWRDAEGNLLNCQNNIQRCFVALGGGMASSDSSTSTNKQGGTINVVNAGIGMWANGKGSTAINQGEINLSSDESIGTDTPYLIGMAALNGGTVVNDTSGVININADYGQAFYSDGTGYIVNNGSINLNGSPIDDQDSHMGVTPTDEVWISSLPGSGDSDTRTSDTGFFTSAPQANYGNETLNGDVDTNGWLYNETNANLTVNGKLTINVGGLENKGTLDADTITTEHSVYNRAGGNMTTDLLTIDGDSTFFNDGDFTGAIAATSYKQEIVNTGHMTVAEDGKSLVSGSFYFYNEEGATLANSGNAVEGGENTIINVTRTSDSLSQVNSGTITATNGYSAITTAHASNNPVWIWNTQTGVINGIDPDAPLINLSRGYNFGNQGTINVQGDNAIAISGGASSYTINLVNSGTINVGTEQGQIDGTNGTGLIGIKGNGKATTINNTADGVINVYADDSYAFGGQTKTIINNGEVNLLCDTGCGIYAPDTTGTQADHNGTADMTIPDAKTAPNQGNVPTPPADPNAPQTLTNYIVGTNSDGSSGTLNANNLVIGDNVEVNTGFTTGTADTTVVVDNAFTGSNIQGAENITSTSVVWNAQGSTDSDGNVDVTMTKNAYADVATDSSVSDVAQALDAGYTNNELYTSLNVGTTAELNNALKQVSGSQATTVFREARILSNRFNMLADAAPQIKDGLAFNVVAKGDPRAELGNDTQYDMLALRQTLDLTASQNLTLEYGIARLDGDGSQKAGDNGLTGGYSQFFGLKHSMAFDEGLAWNNSLRYDVHNLDSSRSVAYGDVNKIADSDARQQYMEFRSEGAKTFSLMDDALKVTPYAGVKFRHTMEDGYKERSAGDFNLSMNSGNETAVDSIVGLKLDYAGKDGWSATATLEGGPNLSYSKSQRTASLQGAAGQSFGVDDGQKGGGVNGLATIGVKYSSNDTALHLDAYQWKEDGISDKGFMLNVKKTFR
ncbi:TPA: autotransporter adhesin BigA [Salmonella enterica]|nr:autotransporter adhesin BigA [Salmonella enterica]